MGIFSTDRRCPRCEARVSRGAGFCPDCGASLGGKRCPRCGISQDAAVRFCTACGADLAVSVAQPAAPAAPPRLKDNRWVRVPGVVAQRIEGADVQDLALRGAREGMLVIEPGVSVMLFQQGKYAGVLTTGAYPLDELRRGWFAGRLAPGAPTTAIMMEEGDIEVTLELDGLRTLDYQDARAALALLLQVQDPEAFLVHLLRGRERMTREDLTGWLAQEVRAIVGQYAGSRPARDFTPGAGLRPEVESELRAELGPALARWGLGLVRLRFAGFTCPQFDREVRQPQAALEIEAERRRLRERERLLKRVEEPAGTLAIEEERTKLRERVGQLRQRVRELENKEFIARFQSRRDLEDYVAQVEHETGLRGLLQRQEAREAELQFYKDELGRREQEGGAQFELDKSELGRAHALDRLRLELSLEHRRTEARLNGELNEEEFERRAMLERMRLEQRLSLEKMEWLEGRERQLKDEMDTRERRLADRRNAAETAAIERENERAETELGLMMLEKTREAARRHRREELLLERENDARRLEMKLEEERRRLQARLDEEERRQGIRLSEAERRARLTMELEAHQSRLRLEEETRRAQLALERERVQGQLKTDHLAVAANAPLEALLATAEGPAAEALARREEMKVMATMSADQLMALAAARSPEMARALAEKFKAEGATQDQQAALLREFMERLERKDQDELARQERRHEQEADRLERMTDRIERLAAAGMGLRAEEAARTERVALDALGQLGGAAQAGAARSDTLSVLLPGTAPDGHRPAMPAGGESRKGANACRGCKRDNPAGSQFCQFCGARL